MARRYSVRRDAIKAGFRSGFEHTLAQFLWENGVAHGYELHKISYTVPAKKCTYTPDFIFEKTAGGLMYVELKGLLDAGTRKKMLHVKECNPDLDIRLCFQYPKNRISKSSKTTYEAWAVENGFPCCGPTLDPEWLSEVNFNSEEF